MKSILMVHAIQNYEPKPYMLGLMMMFVKISEVGHSLVNKMTLDMKNNIIYDELSGPRHAPPSDAKTIAYFNPFITINFLTTLVTKKYQYAIQYLRSHVDLLLYANAQSWRAVTLAEIKGFHAVLFNQQFVATGIPIYPKTLLGFVICST
ncbi:hypothetical protein J6590_034310 [Homalodisca vitripennis]|nr:hypothetical protein J6590_034310 [Homalodisca vitripennis]